MKGKEGLQALFNTAILKDAIQLDEENGQRNWTHYASHPTLLKLQFITMAAGSAHNSQHNTIRWPFPWKETEENQNKKKREKKIKNSRPINKITLVWILGLGLEEKETKLHAEYRTFMKEKRQWQSQQNIIIINL